MGLNRGSCWGRRTSGDPYATTGPFVLECAFGVGCEAVSTAPSLAALTSTEVSSPAGPDLMGFPVGRARATLVNLVARVGDMANTSLRLPGQTVFDWSKELPANPRPSLRIPSLPRPG